MSPHESWGPGRPADLPALPRPDDAHSVRPATQGPVHQAAAARPRTPNGLELAISLLMALRRRWVPALALGLVTAAVASAAAWCVAPRSKYTAKVLLHVAATQPQVLFKTAENRPDYAIYQRTQLTLIKSRHVLETALRSPEVADLPLVRQQPDPVDWLSQQLQAEYAGEVLTLSISGERRPADLAAALNAVAATYVAEVVDSESKERRRHLAELSDLYDDYETKLQERRDRVKELATPFGSVDKQAVQLAQGFAAEHLTTAKQELMRIQQELRKAEAELRVRLERPVSRQGPASAGPVAEESDDAVIQGDLSRLAKLRSAMQRVKGLTRDWGNDPTYQQCRAEAARIERHIEAWRRSARPAGAGGPARGVGASPTGEMRERIAVLRRLERLADDDVDRLSKQVASMNEDSIDLESLKDQIKQSESVARRLGEEVEVLSIETIAPPRVKLFEPAEVPRKGHDKRPVITAGAGLGALAAVLLGIAWLEHGARRISAAGEVTHELGLPVVGLLPALSEHQRRLAGAGGSRDEPWFRMLIESVDSIRTMLLYASRTGPGRVLMVVSAVEGEGKTSLACYLAASLARAGRRTLLVDSDLRRPAVHRMADIPPGPGFAELVRGEAGLDEVTGPAIAEGLHVITAGNSDDRAVRALVRDEVRALFERMRAGYDFVVVDAPPVLPVTDALIIGQHVDLAICSILRDVSQVPKVAAANARLHSLGIRVFGAVVAGLRGDLYSSYYPGMGLRG
jgi:capsular exopolysaccharide synthesis family protein